MVKEFSKSDFVNIAEIELGGGYKFYNVLLLLFNNLF